MKYYQILLLLLVIPGTSRAQASSAPGWLPAFMATSGVGIATIWTIDIVKADKIDISRGYLRAREPGTDTWLLPHWVAEYSTAVLLLTGAYGLHTDREWGRDVSLVALGALNYTSTNSLGWALGKKERLPYAIPMLISLTGSGISLTVLL